MLSALAIKNNKPFLIWSGITVFCAVFGLIYEHFSFGVYSFSMMFMFLYPLLLGALPALFTNCRTNRFWTDGILLLTAGSLLAGILEIYGTSSSFTPWFRILGVVMLLGGVAWNYIGGHKK